MSGFVMKRSIAMSILLGSIAALGAAVHQPALAGTEAPVTRPQRGPRLVGRGTVSSWWNYSVPGWTAAQFKRASIKRKNVARNKRAYGLQGIENGIRK